MSKRNGIDILTEGQTWSRFLCFYAEQYYPGGGLCDVVYECDTEEELRAELARREVDYVLDLETRRSWVP